MRVLIVSGVLPQKAYEELCARRFAPRLDPSQKYFRLLAEGLRRQPGVQVTCLSAPPVSRSVCRDLLVRGGRGQAGGVEYRWLRCVNLPVVRELSRALQVYVRARRFCRRGEAVALICDPLLAPESMAALMACRGLPRLAVVTDLPCYADGQDRHGGAKRLLYAAYHRLSEKVMEGFGGYTLAASAMEPAANPMGKPSMLLECLACPPPRGEEAPPFSRPTVLYTGKLHREFGLELLAKAAVLVKSDCDFLLLGEGNFLEELKEYAKRNPRLRLGGVVTAQAAMALQRRASLLVNPRLPEEAFAACSFPSKTAEYMASGVPVVMFRLPCVPPEYDAHLFYAPKATPQSLAETMDAVLSLSRVERARRARAARAFILQEKGYARQAGRVLHFLQSLNDKGETPCLTEKPF